MGNEAIAELLIRKFADVKKAANDGTTVLHASCVGGNKKIVQKLIDKWADVNAKTKEGITPLLIAVSYGTCLSSFSNIVNE